MSTLRIRKIATLFLGALLIYSAIYTVHGLGNLLRFSFLTPELMINSRFTGGHTSNAMRWTHFLLWLPANLAGIYACLAGVYVSYLGHTGRFFTTRFAKGLQHLGVGVLVSGLADIGATAMVPFNLSALNPAGQRAIQFNFSPEEVGLILCGSGFIAMSMMMLEATRISDENKGFI